MKVTDLMIGDLVMYDEYIDKARNQPRKIARLDKNMFRNNRYYPIPLTPELLEAHGFHKKAAPENDIMPDCWLYVCWNDDENHRIEARAIPSRGMFVIIENKTKTANRYATLSKYIDSVHEFQHALKLCNIEMEFEL